MLEYFDRFRLEDYGSSHWYKCARNIMPLHHVRVARFGINRQGIIMTINKIIRAAEGIGLKSAREHLIWFRKELYGKELDSEADRANNSIKHPLPTLSGT